MTSFTRTSSADWVPAAGTPALNAKALDEAAKAAFQTRTDSIHSVHKEGNGMGGPLEDEENAMEPLAGLFDFLNFDDDEPKVAPDQARHPYHADTNSRVKYAAPYYSHPIQKLAADSEPEITHQYANPAYSEFPTMPWNHTPPEEQYPPTSSSPWKNPAKYQSSPLQHYSNSTSSPWSKQYQAYLASYSTGQAQTPPPTSPKESRFGSRFASTLSSWSTPNQNHVYPASFGTGRSSQTQTYPPTTPKQSRFASQFAAMNEAAAEKREQEQFDIAQVSMEWSWRN